MSYAFFSVNNNNLLFGRLWTITDFYKKINCILNDELIGQSFKYDKRSFINGYY